MTTVYQRPDHTGAGTHVFVIGVGNYPYLVGGSNRLASNPLGLGQLTSPPVSARTLTDWFLAPLTNATAAGFNNNSAPLASLEALISDTAPMTLSSPQGEVQVAPATLNNIQQGFEAWLSRLRSDPGNIGVFYFCGHGVMVADHYLLAEDFGASENRPWENAFDISNTLRAMTREVNGALYFFIDACREISRDIAFTLGADPPALKAVNLKKPVICTSVSLIEAAGEGKLAFAAEGSVSRFTQALLTAMSGYCGIGTPGSNRWTVDGEALAAAVRKLLSCATKTTLRRQFSDQSVSGLSIPLLELASAPKVKVDLELLPQELQSLAILYLRSLRGQRFEGRTMLQIEVPRGFYDVGADCPTGEFAALCYADQELMPPLFGLTIEVQLARVEATQSQPVEAHP